MLEHLNPRFREPNSICLEVGSAIEPESISWLWEGYLARKKMHLLAGPPGTGKTTLAISVASIVSSGGRWPDSTTTPPSNVVIWSTEDDVEDTIVPRLIAAGANMNRVHILRGSFDSRGRPRPFDPENDAHKLQERIAAIGGASLIVVDPILQVIKGDSNKNADVRRGLAPLLQLAETARAAILGITHVNKGSSKKQPADRVNGSLGYVAVSRVVMMVAKTVERDEANRATNVLVRAKSNIGSDSGGWQYTVTPTAIHRGLDQIATSVAKWGDHIVGSAKEILDAAEQGGEDAVIGGALGRAMTFLQTLLESGPKSYPEIMDLAKKEVLSEATLRRAKARLAIQVHKSTGLGQFSPHMWALPMTALTHHHPSMLGAAVAPFTVPTCNGQPHSPPEQHRHHDIAEAYRNLGGAVPAVAQGLDMRVEQVEQPEQPEQVVPSEEGVVGNILELLMAQCRAAWNARAHGDEDGADLIDRIVHSTVEATLDEYSESDRQAYKAALRNRHWWNHPSS